MRYTCLVGFVFLALSTSCRADESKSILQSGHISKDEAGSKPTTTARPSGPIDLPGVYNTRDPGGLQTLSGKRVRRNVLFRSGHLANLSATGCDRLKLLEIRTILDVRAAREAHGQAVPACVTASADYRLVDLPKHASSAQGYARTLDALEPKLGGIFEALSKPDALPALIPCMVGRDRASLVMAVLLLALGVSQEHVVADFIHNRDPAIGVQGSWLQPLFERVEASGGIRPYLRRHGVTESMLETFLEGTLE